MLEIKEKLIQAIYIQLETILRNELGLNQSTDIRVLVNRFASDRCLISPNYEVNGRVLYN